ncbi:MAG: winged helix-turn-helix domain-containing protein [Candidatus Odinarchaeota archaeon]
MTNRQEKKTNSQKILDYLQENPGDVSNEELAREIEIDKSNIPREIKKIENQGYNISRRYEQVGRSKYVWFQLTDSQGKETNSQSEKIKEKKLILKNSNHTIKSKNTQISNIPSQTKRNKTEKQNLTQIFSDKPLNPNQIQELIKVYKEIQLEFQENNRLIPLSKKIELFNWLLKNLDYIYEGVYNYLKVWETRYNKRLKEEPDSPVIPKFESMTDVLEKIKEIRKLKKNNSYKLKSKEESD